MKSDVRKIVRAVARPMCVIYKGEKRIGQLPKQAVCRQSHTSYSHAAFRFGFLRQSVVQPRQSHRGTPNKSVSTCTPFRLRVCIGRCS